MTKRERADKSELIENNKKILEEVANDTRRINTELIEIHRKISLLL